MMSRGLEMVIERNEEGLRGSGGAVNARAEKLVRWFMFSVLVSLVPLALTYFNLWVDRRDVHLEMVVARGELLLVSTTLGAAALGEFFPGTRHNALEKLLSGGALVLLMLTSSFFFAVIQARQGASPRSLFAVSLALFAGILAAAGSCMFYSHQEAP